MPMRKGLLACLSERLCDAMRTNMQGIVARAERWEGQVGDLETALLLLGATEGESEEEEDEGLGRGEEAAEVLQEAGRVARELGEDLRRWQVRAETELLAVSGGVCGRIQTSIT